MSIQDNNIIMPCGSFVASCYYDGNKTKLKIYSYDVTTLHEPIIFNVKSTNFIPVNSNFQEKYRFSVFENHNNNLLVCSNYSTYTFELDVDKENCYHEFEFSTVFGNSESDNSSTAGEPSISQNDQIHDNYDYSNDDYDYSNDDYDDDYDDDDSEGYLFRH